MIRIITDSAADFTQEELRQLDIRCVPMTISFSDETYRDGVDLTSETFWQRMQAGETPKTSQPSPDAFLSEFEDAKACGDSVICILISTALSGTVQSAMIARDMADDDSIQIIDTLSAAVGERLLVLQACKLRDEGKDAQTIAAELTALIPRVRIFACLDTVSYTHLDVYKRQLMLIKPVRLFAFQIHTVHSFLAFLHPVPIEITGRFAFSEGPALRLVAGQRV